MLDIPAETAITLAKRQEIVAEAESWIGTPFHHEARRKGPKGGVDCGQLLIGVYGKLGYMPENFKVAHYPPDFAAHKNVEWYLSILEEFGEQVSMPRPGDAVLFKWGRLFSHGGIVVEWPIIVHAWAPTKSVLRYNAEFNPLASKERRFYSAFGAY